MPLTAPNETLRHDELLLHRAWRSRDQLSADTGMTKEGRRKYGVRCVARLDFPMSANWNMIGEHMTASRPYLARLLDRQLRAAFRELPALMLVGPRAAGKTTTARELVPNLVRLDRAAEAAPFLADPDAALAAQDEPVVLDEWQEVPDVLGAVKRAVDNDPRAGRFILTGSVRNDLAGKVWPGTGRIARMSLYGLTLRELHGRAGDEPFIDRLARADISLFRAASPTPDLTGYMEVAFRSGFPDVLLPGLSDNARQRWLDGYAEQLLTRDVPGVIRAPARLRRYFEALAINSAGLPKEESLYTAAGIDYKTAKSYQDLLGAVYVLDIVPSFENRRLQRMVKMPKRYIVDPGLMSVALRLDARAAMRDGDLIGRVLDTFVMAQLRPELEISTLRPRLYHLREEHGRHEIDIVGDLANGVVGIEVKAAAAPSLSDARHLVHLRDRLKSTFLGGAVLHTGPQPFSLSDRIFALPIATLWG